MNNHTPNITVTGGNAYLTGALTFATVVQLRIAGDQLIAKHARLDFDFENVTHCDSSALTLLTAWTRSSQRHGKVVSFINLPQQLRDIAKISGLDKVLSLWTN